MFAPSSYRGLSWRYRLATLLLAVVLSLSVIGLWAIGMRFAKVMSSFEHRAAVEDAAAARQSERHLAPGEVGVDLLAPAKPAR